MSEANLRQVRWQDFEVVVAVKSGESDGVEVLLCRTIPLDPSEYARGRVSQQKRRLLVQVSDPQDLSTHARIKVALGLLRDA